MMMTPFVPVFQRMWADKLRVFFVLWIVWNAVGLMHASFSQEDPQADPNDLPRIPPVPVEEALSTFELREGIALDLVAHEPVVLDPVSIAFDEDGRLFAVEMRGYSERRDEKRGRIRMLFDDDDDGVFDRSTVYARDLRWPTGVVCFGGGIFVVASPDLIWFKDSDGDGVADERKVVFTGFGEGVSRLNVQGLPNSLKWGPDNRIWGSSGTQGGKVRPSGDQGGKEINLSGSDFSFDPFTLDFRAENGRAQYGLSFDTHGSRFVSSNSNHLIAVMWERSWTKPSPWYSMPAALTGIAVDGGAAPVYRISPDEPWRIVRTRWRIAGVVGGPVEGGGRVSGYFTGASGVTIYTGDALGTQYVNNAFTGDVGSNLVHRKVVSRVEDRVELSARRPLDEQDHEFIASTDNWFRPTTYCNGPDGCLYICDMHREVIEHPWSLPEGIKQYLDLNSGTDRGRIYRVRPAEFERRPTTRLSEATSDELVAFLEHPNGWHRVTAQRLLRERQDLRAGDGWAESYSADVAAGKFRRALELAKREEGGVTETLTGILEDAPDDTWMRAAVLNAVRSPDDAGSIFSSLTGEGLDHPALEDLAEVAGRMNQPELTEAVLRRIASFSTDRATNRLLESLGEGLNRSKSSLAEADREGILKPIFDAALKTVESPGTSIESKIAAIELSAFSPSRRAKAVLQELLSRRDQDKLYLPVVQALRKLGSKSIGRLVFDNWDHYPVDVQGALINLLMESSEGTRDVLAAIGKEVVPRERLNQSQVDLLRKSKDGRIRREMASLFPETKKVPREEIVAGFSGALSRVGDPIKGKEIYRMVCASCHRHGTEGHVVGPDLATFKTAGNESIIGSLFDPNKEVAPQYQAYVIELGSGEQLLGVIANETTTEVTVRQAFGIEKTFPRVEVKSMKSLGQSLMPEGLENSFTDQSLADLLAFIAG